MIETEMTEVDCVLNRMGIDVSESMIEEASEGVARAIWELEEAITQIRELAQQIEDEGDEELAEELRDKAFKLEYPYL